MKFQRLTTMLFVLVVSSISTQAFADRRAGTAEATIFVPYVYGESYGFEGGAGVNTNSSTGFGVGLGYNYTDQVTLIGDISWNGIKYDATRILDDGNGTVQGIKGKLDTWSMRFGGDYYFTNGRISPFINGNLGWTFIDTNVPSGPPGTVCWWDPWWGYICSGYQNTHTENNFNYGVGVGLRMEIGRSNFAKLGYYNTWMDFETSSGSSSLNSLRLEFGFSF